MIPYTLTKRPAPVKRKKPPLPSVKSANVGEDSDSDGEPVSFFSHLENVDPTEPCGLDTHSDVPGSCYDNSSELSLDAAPSAPKPFTVGWEGGGTWEEGGVPADPYLESELNSGEGVVTDDRYQQPIAAPVMMQGAGSMPGAGPGLSMDDKAVSNWTIGLLTVWHNMLHCSIAG